MKKLLLGLLLIVCGGLLFITFQNRKLYIRFTQSPITPTLSTSSHISKGLTPSFPLQLPTGFTIHVFAGGISNARDMEFSPGGTLLVSSPQGNSVYALPDTKHNGIADKIVTVISGEHHVHGLAFYNNQLFIADTDKVVRYNWNEATLSATKDKVLFSLPQNSDHNNRTLIFDSNGILYVSVASTCDVCHEVSPWSGTVIVSNANGDNPHVFASGLRNAAFLAFNPTTHELWGTEMGRDYLGDTVPPDEINIIKSGQNYGWPNCYGNKVHDTIFDKNPGNPCLNTIAPIYEIPAHSSPLGLAFINSSQFPKDWQGDLLVAYHGSWNRSIPIGYSIVHLKVQSNTITSSDDFLTGFLRSTRATDARGRPVDVIFDKSGNLYVSDDKAGNIYIIQKK